MFGTNEKALGGRVDPKQLMVSRAGRFLRKDAVSNRDQAAAADVVCQRNRRCRGRACKAIHFDTCAKNRSILTGDSDWG
jgi:hypothetical protein